MMVPLLAWRADRPEVAFDGKKAGVAPGMVSAIVWACSTMLLNTQIGVMFPISTWNICDFLELLRGNVAAVIRELTAKGIILMAACPRGRSANPGRKMAAPNAREYRERNRTQPNATERKRPEANANEHREDKIREEENREEKKDAGPSAPALSIVPPSTPELRKTDLYRRGKEILGASGSGLITNLLKAKGGSVD